MSDLDYITKCQTFPNETIEDGAIEPPSTNRGVLSDSIPNGLCDRFIFDWFSYTFKVNSDYDIKQVLRAIEFLLGDKIEFSERARMRGYTDGGFVCEGLGRVAFSFERLEMGVHLSLPGQALSFLRERFGEGWDGRQFLLDICSFVAPCLEDSQEGGHCTRIDFAYDDFSGSIDINHISDLVKRRLGNDEPTMVTRSRAVPREMRQLDGVGHTIYFGSKNSDTQVRIYDKAAQQDVEGEWTRVEGQFRRDRANQTLRAFLSDGSDAVSGVMLAYLDFKDLSSDAARVQDRPTVSWWSDFLGVGKKLFLSTGAVVKSLQDTVDWVYRQVGPALAMMKEAGIGSEISKIIKSGENRLTEVHRHKIERFKELSKGVFDDLDIADRAERKRYEQLGAAAF